MINSDQMRIFLKISFNKKFNLMIIEDFFLAEWFSSRFLKLNLYFTFGKSLVFIRGIRIIKANEFHTLQRLSLKFYHINYDSTHVRIKGSEMNFLWFILHLKKNAFQKSILSLLILSLIQERERGKQKAIYSIKH